jgi:hypothetical protein
MKQSKQIKNGYLIHQTENKFIICKILNEYNSQQEANNDLVDLLTKKKKEDDLLKEFNNKESW